MDRDTIHPAHLAAVEAQCASLETSLHLALAGLPLETVRDVIREALNAHATAVEADAAYGAAIDAARYRRFAAAIREA